MDLANCYDAVAHPIARIVLQSFKVCKVMVAMMLYALKTMTWYLKTAFGQSNISFGGMVLDPSMGLGQGNGVASLGFPAVCTLMINVSHNLGHGIIFIGAWAWDAFTLSAVLYVDDSDLFHMALETPSDEEFLQIVQSATNDWVCLVHATGGSLKPQKCCWYVLGLIWKKGKACLKALYELPHTPLYIPLLGKTRVPIQLKTVSDPEKKLGVYIYLTGNFSYHVEQLLTMRLQCAEQLGARRLLARDAWMGKCYKLFPKLISGAAAVTHSPQKLEEAFQPSGINCYPLFVLTGTSLRSIQCSPFGFRDEHFQI